jgi:hypothetical protein
MLQRLKINHCDLDCEPQIKRTNSEKADFETSDFTAYPSAAMSDEFSWKKSSCVTKRLLLTGNKGTSEPTVRRKENSSNMD